MKKIFAITGLVLILTAASIVSYLIISEKILFRLPLLVHQSPRITFAIGDTFYRATSNAEWDIAIVGQELRKGYEVKTGKRSQLDIRFHRDMAIKVTERSVLKIDATTVKKMQLEINKGSLFGKFDKLFKDYQMNVKTPTAIAGIRGTELGFEIHDTLIDADDTQKEETGAEKKGTETMVYSLSGITELYNPQFKDQKILLSDQKKLALAENAPPQNPEKMTEEEIRELRSKLNSIHFDEVLFISDKINFEVGSAKIIPSSYPELDKIARIIKKKDVKVRIEGHTDSQSSAAFNQTLSEKRANAIRDYFIKKEIDPESLETVGYGESKPIADNETKEGRAMNRRVEFIIVE